MKSKHKNLSLPSRTIYHMAAEWHYDCTYKCYTHTSFYSLKCNHCFKYQFGFCITAILPKNASNNHLTCYCILKQCCCSYENVFFSFLLFNQISKYQSSVCSLYSSADKKDLTNVGSGYCFLSCLSQLFLISCKTANKEILVKFPSKYELNSAM